MSDPTHRLSLPILALSLALVAACGESGESAADASSSQDASTMVVHQDPNCGCCGDWVDYMRAEGFEVVVHMADNIHLKRRELGVPAPMASCHTAEIGGYLVEGHVPADAVRQLLAERPQARGISAPGMPWGSPGMEIGDRVDTYPVVLFQTDGSYEVLARYHGHERL